MIKTLAKSIRQYKKSSILTPVFMFFEVLLEVSIPTLMARLIDDGISAGNMNEILRIGAILLGAALLSLAAGYMAGKFAAHASTGFASNLRNDIYQNIQNFSFHNIDKFSTASLITRLTTDVTNVQNAYQMIIRLAFRAPLMLIFAFVASMLIDNQLSLIFVAFIPILAIFLYIIQSKAHVLFERVFNTYDHLNSVVGENLSGMRAVKAYNREDYEDSKFKKISMSIFKDFSKAETIIALNGPVMQFCVFCSMILLAWFGAHAIVNSGNNEDLGLSTGELTSLIAYTMQILMSLMMLSFVFVMIVISRASAERITQVLNEKSDLTDGKEHITEIRDGSIEFNGVNFRYSENAEKNVLEGINFKINSGETVGILGGTGSSKSSLVSLIPRLYDATEGNVKVGGIDVRDYNIKELRDAVSVVLQKNVLFSGTIKDNIRWGNEDATDEEIERVCKLACADSFIEQFPDRYDTYIEQGGTNVSGGQKQRLCIARALMKKPKVLILDDSTSAVDTKTDAQIRKALREEIPHTTKLIIAQRVASVEDADKIIILDDGHISAMGTHLELMENSAIYREVYESQNRVTEA
ncbi:MAG: ABC transporter ATP-binding protein/permease [Ruminococcus sp.]|jgi:ATP-binding cassette subfamily B protein|nr:ABC transporter ATP-binding protein/permease [Ruminococcus sp.]